MVASAIFILDLKGKVCRSASGQSTELHIRFWLLSTLPVREPERRKLPRSDHSVFWKYRDRPTSKSSAEAELNPCLFCEQPLISRVFRPDVEASAASEFVSKVLNVEDVSLLALCFTSVHASSHE